MRFLDPDAGRVSLGGTDVRALRQRDVRSVVSLDRQDAYLFSTTIEENVRLANPGARDTEIERALTLAKIRDWVETLPDGWDTFVGEEGTRVSGGERRRIALARTFLADAPIIVLDEPTAHLDPPTATAIVSDAMVAAGGRAVLLITHRPEELDAVDEVITLCRGRVIAVARVRERDRPSGARMATMIRSNLPWPVRSVIAGAVGTTIMTLAYGSERRLRSGVSGSLDYDDSLVPGEIVASVLHLPSVTAREESELGTALRWGYGSAFGIWHGTLRRVLPEPWASVAFGATLMSATLTLFPMLGRTPPPWRWSPDVLLTSFGTHAAYVAAVAVVDDALR